MQKQSTWFIILAVILFGFSSVSAQQYTSGSYKVNDPVVAPGGYAASSNFKLNSVLYQIAPAGSNSLTFKANSGFLYFPYATTPTVSATPGNASVTLNWSPSVGFLGWNVSSYSYGVSTVSGGPYSYTSIGSTTSTTVSGLTNGTTYYFVIRSKDAFGNFLATSTQVSGLPTGGTGGTGGSGGGGGGGGGGGVPPSSNTGVIISGRAYPLTKVYLLKDGQLSVQTISGPDANFQINLTNLSGGDYNFSLYGEDKDKRKSPSVSFPVTLASGAVTNITGVYLAPSITTDKSEVRRGDTIDIFGQSVPNAKITIAVNSPQEYFLNVPADANGVYLAHFDTVPLEYGNHTSKSRSATSTEVSQFGFTAPFKVGDKNVARAIGNCPQKGDLNDDCKVNLVDFSIAAFWYHRTLSSSFASLEKEKLSGDGKVTITDFSIMAYYWTG